MGDRYRRDDRDRRAQYGRPDHYDPYYDRRDNFDEYDRSRYSRSNGRRDRSMSPPRQWDSRDSQYGQHNGSYNYTFRGAAARDEPRPENAFSFRAINQPAPRFPSPPRRPQPQKQSAPRNDVERRGPNGRRADQGYRGRGGFKRRKAHTRDILNKVKRGGTPEQLQGMNTNGQAHYAEVLDSSSESDSDDEEVIDLTQDSAEEENGGRAHAKRIKTEAAAAEPAVVPKWSNPDPYTSLPPPETLGAPKKDIVQVIRKAKIDSARPDQTANAVKANDDFISFFSDAGSEEGEVSDVSEPSSARLPLQNNAPSAPSRMRDLPNGNTTSSSAFSFTSFHSHPPFSSRAPNANMEPASGLPPPPAGVEIPTAKEIAHVARQVQGNKQGGKKRKFDQSSAEIGDVLDEWKPNGSNPAPWCKNDWSNVTDVGLRLHHEICEFAEFVQPYDYEEAVRRQLIDRVQRAISQWRGRRAVDAKNVDIRCFGSFAAGLYLPTADMDLVAVSRGFMQMGRRSFCQTNGSLHELARYLVHTGIAAPESVSPVTRAKVPIVKYTDKFTDIRVDISFENETGLIANRTFQEWKEEFPKMPTLVVIIKQLLAMRDLNEVYTGGVGGFSIICLVVNLLQLLSPAQRETLHYGDLLCSFFEYYGTTFDLLTTGIIMKPHGTFNKITHPMKGQNATGLTIVDPNRPDNDISGGSRNVGIVFNVFRSALTAIHHRQAQIERGIDVGGSILECVLGGNYSSVLRQRNKLSLLHRGRPASPPPPPAPKQSATDLSNRPSGNTQTMRANFPQKPPTTVAGPSVSTLEPPISGAGLPPKPPPPVVFGGPSAPSVSIPQQPAAKKQKVAVPPEAPPAGPWGATSTPTYPLPQSAKPREAIAQPKPAVPASKDSRRSKRLAHQEKVQAQTTALVQPGIQPLTQASFQDPTQGPSQAMAPTQASKPPKSKKERKRERTALMSDPNRVIINPNSPYHNMTLEQKNEAQAKSRANSFKKKYPNATGVPDALSKKQKRDLLATHAGQLD